MIFGNAGLLPLVFLLLVGVVDAQDNALEFERTDTIASGYTPRLNSPYIFIPSRFGSDEVSAREQLDSVKEFVISRIELVYSKYQRSGTFNQARLNDARWSNLRKLYPSLFAEGYTRYRNVCQAGSQDTSAHRLIHGFFIYFRNPADVTKRTNEITEITKMLEKAGVSADDTTDRELGEPEEKAHDAGTPVTLRDMKSHSPARFRKPMRTIDPHACRRPYYEGGIEGLNAFFSEHIRLRRRQKRKWKNLTATVRLRIDFSGEIKTAQINARGKRFSKQVSHAIANMVPWNPAIRNGLTVKSDVKFKLRYGGDGKIVVDGDVDVPRNLARCGTGPDSTLFNFSAPVSREKLIPGVFEVADGEILRNVVERNPTMDSLLVAVDLTGSMGPYIAQVIDLMADLVVKNDPYVACFALFNDGDRKDDSKKTAGNTGGIQIIRDINLDKLGKGIVRTMKRGDGGDRPENNVEAVIKGLENCPECKDVLMVADNWATPRDGNLLRDLKRPLHWILCGVAGEINTEYMDLVRLNKGYLHTNKSDVSNLHLMRDGETITIDGMVYQLSRQKFRRMNLN